jgi:hypothetical protein
VEELRAQGWSEEAIELERAEAAYLAEPGLLWAENWTIGQVFLACRWIKLMGLNKYIWDDISTQEIVASLLLHRIPRNQWTEHFTGVRIMVIAALPELNKEAG